MKTQIIKLEAHDDLISTRDKMGWGKTGRILIVWPERGQVLHNRLELVLIHRHSQTLGAQLGLVTRNSEIRQHAYELGIPVYKNLRKAQLAIWRSPRHIRREQTWRSIMLRSGKENQPRLDLRTEKPVHTDQPLSLATRLIFFSLGILAILALVAFFAPQATIMLQPEVKEQQIELTVTANPDADNINLTGTVPFRLISVIVEGRDQLTVSGTIGIPDQPAGGLVTFTNLSDLEIHIPVGSVVQTRGQPPVRFTTTRAGVVVPGPGTAINLPVRALQPGEAGNISAGEIQAIEGPLGIELTVINPRPFIGGSELTSFAPTQEDYSSLLDQLSESLRQTAIKELQATLDADDLLIEDSIKLSRVLEQIYQPAEIQPANELILNLRLEYTARVIRHSDLIQLAENVLNARLVANYLPLPGSLEITHLDQPMVDPTGKASWPLLAKRHIQAEISPTYVSQLALGMHPIIAQQQLVKTLPLASNPEIRIWPNWWPRLPALPFRIAVNTTN